MFKKGSIQIGTFAGIPLKVHWTFSLIFVFVLWLGLSREREMREIGLISILVIVSFLCVVLHEYGHALMARRFQVRTIDIILSPIGGLARLERLPSKPIQEFFIAIAGPLVNFALAGILSVILWIGSKPLLIDLNSSVSNFDNWGAYISIVLYINLLLFFFNLIPAFPMDGGRILRSLLSIRLGKKRSTDIASYIGYAIAVGFIVVGFFISYYTLSVIGVFVMLMARGEKISARHEDFLVKNDTDLDGLMSFHGFNQASPMQELLHFYHDKSARNFMVVDDDSNLVGVVTEPAIRACLKEQNFDSAISEYSHADFGQVETLNLQAALSLMNSEKRRFLVVNGSREGRGMLERYRVIERMNRS